MNSPGEREPTLSRCALRGKKPSDDRPPCLENPSPKGAEPTLTENVASPFQAEPRHYYRRLPIAELIPLAAHFIVSAGKLNGSAIEGLEIILCQSGAIQRMANDSARELEEKSNQWDHDIGDFFRKHKQAYKWEGT